MDDQHINKTFREFLHQLADRHTVTPDVPALSSADIDYWQRRMTPLAHRLKLLLESIPVSVQTEGLHVNAIASQLAGRYNGKAAPREVAAELRKLKYTMRRSFKNRDTTGCTTLWFPPSA
jgi:hypothetical protein